MPQNHAKLWEYADAGLWLGDAAGKCIAINPALRRLLNNLAAADFATLTSGDLALAKAYRELRRDSPVTVRLTIGGGSRRAHPVRITLARLPNHRVLITFFDAAHETAAQHDLDAVAQAFASGVGEHLLEGLVLSLSLTVPADFVFISRLAGKARDHLQTVAFAEDGVLQPNRTYPLAGAPCADVIRVKGISIHESHVARRFPADKLLVKSGAQSYAGAPLADSVGRVLGLMAVLDRRPFDDPARVARLLKIYAARAALELERMAIDQRELHRAKSRASLTDAARKPRPGSAISRAVAAKED